MKEEKPEAVAKKQSDDLNVSNKENKSKDKAHVDALPEQESSPSNTKSKEKVTDNVDKTRKNSVESKTNLIAT